MVESDARANQKLLINFTWPYWNIFSSKSGPFMAKLGPKRSNLISLSSVRLIQFYQYYCGDIADSG